MGTTSWGATLRTVVGGLWFGEGPRWHDGVLWCSDMHGHRVLRIDLAAADVEAEVVVEVPDGEPSGLGWLPDGRLLVVEMVSRQVRRLEHDGRLVVHADLSPAALGVLNDMVVSDTGTAYVGDMGYDIHTAAPERRPGQLFRVDPDGSFHVAASDLNAPNGPAITADGRTLVVAESGGFRLTAFTISGDGSLTDRRTFCDVPPAPGATMAPPDGICLDVDGAAWVADPVGRRVVRVAPGGRATHWVDYPDEVPVACVLGGPERRTLLICVGPEWRRAQVVAAGRPMARIDAVGVDTPGLGRP